MAGKDGRKAKSPAGEGWASAALLVVMGRDSYTVPKPTQLRGFLRIWPLACMVVCIGVFGQTHLKTHGHFTVAVSLSATVGRGLTTLHQH